MRIFAFSDYHGNKENLPHLRKAANQADILLCCGDIAQCFGVGLEESFDDLLSLGKQTYLIHGNHESCETLASLCEENRQMTYLHGSGVRLGDIFILGYGGVGVPLIDPSFDQIIASNMVHMKDARCCILMTHAPPYETALDKVLGIGRHVGNKSYRQASSLFDYHFCGHNHETFGQEDRVYQCRVLNVSPKGVLLESSSGTITAFYSNHT